MTRVVNQAYAEQGNLNAKPAARTRRFRDIDPSRLIIVKTETSDNEESSSSSSSSSEPRREVDYGVWFTKVGDSEKCQKMAQRQRNIVRLKNQLSKVKKIRLKLEKNWTNAEYKTMLTYKKRNKGDEPTTNVKDRTKLMLMWEERRNRPSPNVSDVEDANVDDDDSFYSLEDTKIPLDDMVTTNENGEVIAGYV